MDMGMSSDGDSVGILFFAWAGVCVSLDYIVQLFFESVVLLGGTFFLDLNPINSPFYIDLNSSVFSPIFFIEDP
jgi:hypothetical protein